MKDHSLDFNDSKKFILSYKIENGKIVAKLASGEVYTVPYTEENENIIISKMEEQVRCAQPKPLWVWETHKFLAISNSLNLPVAISHFVNYGGWLWGTILAFVTVEAIKHSAIVITNVIKNRNIKKLKDFLDHKEELNKSVEKSENMELGISKNDVKQIDLQESENKEPFNINNMNNYSLSDLKILEKNIERISSFGFNDEETESEDVVEEKGPVKKRTLENKRK